MKEKTVVWAIIVIFILGLAVYYNSLNGRFIWDDEYLIKKNIYIRDWSGISRIFTDDIGTGASEEYNFYRPLQILSYRVDYCLWRLRAQGYHLTNILLHIFVALAIYWLINILYKNRFLSFFTSIFFLIHPVHTEVVAYLAGRADSLALLFMLLCFIFYVKHLRSKSISFYALTVLSYILALLSKENALILPGLLLLYHYTLEERLEIKKFLPIASVAVIYIVIRGTILKSILPDASGHFPLFQRIPGFFVAITEYARLLLLPFNLHMEYGYKSFSFSNPKAIIGVLLIFFLLVYLVKKRKAKGLAFLSISWFFVSLLPVSNIYPLNTYMAEHWLYLPSIGFFLVLAKGLSYVFRAKNFRIFTIAFISILLIFWSYLTARQCDYWKEPIAFCKRTLEYAPESLKMHISLGYAYHTIGRYKDAITSYEKALEIDPDYADAYYNLGTAYDATGEREEAIEAYKRVIEIDPSYSKAYNNLGKVYSDIGKNDEATALHKKAIAINPRHANAYYNLGNEYRRIGRNKEAITSYKKAIEINPYEAAAHNNLAVAYYHDKEYSLAIKHCDRAIELGCQVHPEFLKLLEAYR